MCETQAHLLGVLRNTGMPISADQIVSDAYTTCEHDGRRESQALEGEEHDAMGAGRMLGAQRAPLTVNVSEPASVMDTWLAISPRRPAGPRQAPGDLQR